VPIRRSIAAIAAVAAVGAYAVLGVSNDLRIPSAGVVPPPFTSHDRTPIPGAASCFGVTCHGNPYNRDSGACKDCSPFAATIWVNHDRHRLAYEVLSSAASNQIMKALRPDAEHGSAARDERCLACHTNPRRVYLAGTHTLDTEDVRAARSDGVSCDTCHGDASGWLEEHTKWRSKWGKTANPSIYAEKRMLWRNDLHARAQLCVGCHVGAPEANEKEHFLPRRDVTHDLIAAGHPRLTFEFTSFLNRMPRHWCDRDRTNWANEKDKASDRSIVARTWLVGQAACVAAEVRLLDDSARRPDWPEFSRLGCYACHHDLESKSWRRPEVGALRGGLSLDSWNFFVPRPRFSNAAANLRRSRPPSSAGEHTALTRLQTDFRRLITTVTREPRAASEIDAALTNFQSSLEYWRDAPDSIQTFKATLLDLMDEETLKRLAWDDAAQIYYALTAWKDAAGGGSDHFSKQLETLADNLQFKTAFSSPRGYAPCKVIPTLRSLRKLLESQNEKTVAPAGN
jgi:hypothetical protein